MSTRPKRKVLDRIVLYIAVLYYLILWVFIWNSMADLQLINGWLPVGLVNLLWYSVVGIFIGWYLIFFHDNGTGL